MQLFSRFLDNTRLGVWILDGDPLHKNLLQYAITPKSITNTLIVHVVDISRPWTIMESLHLWTEVLREHIHSLKLPPKELNEMEERSKFNLDSYFSALSWYSICYCVEDDKSNCRAGVSKSLYYCWYSCLTDFCSWPVCKIAKNIFCTVFVCQKFNFIPRSRILIETLHLDTSLTVKLSG